MTEKQKESDFFKKAVAAGTVVAGAGTLWLGGQTVSNISNASASEEALQAAHESKLANTEILENKLHGQFDESQVVGEMFIIKEGQGLTEPSLAQIEAVYHDDFNNLKPLIYDNLMTAAKLQGTVQPGEHWVVVEDDIDPENDNGKEYLPARESQIVHSPIDALPTPDTH